MPTPQRGPQGYRLYSEHDIRILKWLKHEVDSGTSIGKAVENLDRLQKTGGDLVMDRENILINKLPSIKEIELGLFKALKEINQLEAEKILQQAFTLFPLEVVFGRIIQKNLVKIGNAWHRNEMPIAVEHFATQFFTSQLLSMAGSGGIPNQKGTIIAACAPGETHQIGLLMTVVLLRWRGWDVRYLGPDLSLQGLADALIPVNPRMILFSATMKEHAEQLNQLENTMRDFPDPKPIIVLGGQAFLDYCLSKNISAHYFHGNPEQNAGMIENILKSNNVHETIPC
jgi:MerR family transcriptional regulator, light-induced transcriptional regulator